ncbi:LysE family translocator [Photobacterium galatheae]|uniref:Threonine transporter n=1 Tax=Photobacterium galatheae TaxID=1654360 RepID=A0A066RPS3_9GAMM|nr:LysE family translocator [Photobacterium galatheae]KDM91106.1 threonine transporter [Photobacterium galatheae]MCM0150172.1 LysE family translocator [Photobacterium galatheae]
MSFLLLWLGVMFPLVFSPGPANIVFAASGASVGVRRSIPLLLGIDFVFVIKSLLIGLGLGALIHEHPMVLQLLQVAGACYIMYLAKGFLKTSLHQANGPLKHLGFTDGVLIQLLNSKGWLLVLLMFSLFSEKAQHEFGDHAVWVLIVWLAVLNISMHFVWIWAGGLLAKLSGNRKNQKIQGFIYFSLMMVVAIWLLVDNPLWQHLVSSV